MGWVIAAYAVVGVPLVGYALHLRGRLRALRRASAAPRNAQGTGAAHTS